jgi:hypothetical protein
LLHNTATIIKRGVMGTGPLQRGGLRTGEFSPARGWLSKDLAPHRFSEGSGADRTVNPGISKKS